MDTAEEWTRQLGRQPLLAGGRRVTVQRRWRRPRRSPPSTTTRGGAVRPPRRRWPTPKEWRGKAPRRPRLPPKWVVTLGQEGGGDWRAATHATARLACPPACSRGRWRGRGEGAGRREPPRGFFFRCCSASGVHGRDGLVSGLRFFRLNCQTVFGSSAWCGAAAVPAAETRRGGGAERRRWRQRQRRQRRRRRRRRPQPPPLAAPPGKAAATEKHGVTNPSRRAEPSTGAPAPPRGGKYPARGPHLWQRTPGRRALWQRLGRAGNPLPLLGSAATAAGERVPPPCRSSCAPLPPRHRARWQLAPPPTGASSPQAQPPRQSPTLRMAFNDR